jgi:hypothetical protein
MTQPLRAIQTEHVPQAERHDRASTVVLSVRLAGCNGERWDAIGIGSSQAEALSWALESAPAGVAWLVSSWSDTYGD